MKKQSFFYKISFFFIFLISTATITYSWNWLLAENWDIISATKWNELVSSLNNKLESTQIIAWSNITITPNGNNLEINSTGGSWNYPYISLDSTVFLSPNTNYNITITGENFSPNSQVNIPNFDGTIHSTSANSPAELIVNITTGNNSQTYDLVVNNWWLLSSVWTGNWANLISVITPVLWTWVSGVYNEWFESNNIWNWTDSAWNDANFLVQTAGTPSSGTGPNSASTWNYYIFPETSNPNNPNKVFAIETSNFRQAQSISFDYHMHWGNIWTLIVETLYNWAWTDVYNLTWQQHTNQTDAWLNSGNIDISNKLVEKIRIRYTSGSGYQWDAWIDNVIITSI